MTDQAPSLEEWKGLYDAAVEFKEAEPWDWMWDSDLFGVQNPATGEVGYCCVMGRLGEHFALGLYPGTEGLQAYLKIVAEDLSPDDMLQLQRCLMASFEDRKLLSREDLDVIKRLGLKFRGRQAWPVFRSYQPGFYPWYLTSEEAQYLTVTLQQAIHVALRFQDDPDMLAPPVKNQYLVRVLEKSVDGLQWKDVWLEPRPLERVPIPAQPIDACRLQRLSERIPNRKGIWEFDYSYSPMPARDNPGERPYFPHVIFCVDQDSGFVLACDLVSPVEPVSGLAEHVVAAAERMGSLPREIRVRREEVFQVLEAVTSRLGVRLRLTKSLAELGRARRAMFGFLDR
ncbi:MAG: hypothetical protein JSW37_07800 [Anaerolineales bacterium]|nr:MAG: hypothetical protein JSW37_07800 [Anaerolineales bacterium]